MNHKDFEIARKKIKTKLAHKAILKKMLETRVSRPRAITHDTVDLSSSESSRSDATDIRSVADDAPPPL